MSKTTAERLSILETELPIMGRDIEEIKQSLAGIRKDITNFIQSAATSYSTRSDILELKQHFEKEIAQVYRIATARLVQATILTAIVSGTVVGLIVYALTK